MGVAMMADDFEDAFVVGAERGANEGRADADDFRKGVFDVGDFVIETGEVDLG